MEPVAIINPILEGNFYTSSKKNSFYQVKVDENYLGLLNTNGNLIKTRMISIRDIVGCRCARRRKRIGENCECHPKSKNRVLSFLENTLDEQDISAYLHIYSYITKNSKTGSALKRESFKLTLRFRLFSSYEDNLKEAIKWRNTLKGLVEKMQWRNPLLKNVENYEDDDSKGNKLLIVLNPKSGPGKSREIFDSEIMPILTEADIPYDLYVTRARNDARNYIKTSNVLKWKRGIVTVGGDGVLFEVVNGIMERTDWKDVVKSIPLAIIPGGSGNGLAKSLSFCSGEPYDQNPVLISMLNVIKGFPAPVDLVRIETQSEIAFSFLSFGWGLIADIDIESERLRIIGSPRFMIWTVARLIGLRTYTGRLSFLRVPPEKVEKVVASDKYIEVQIQDSYLMEEDTDKKSSNQIDCNSNSSFDMDSISLDTGCIRGEPDRVGRTESFYSLSSHKSAYHSDNASSSYLSLPETTKKSRTTIYGPTSQLPSLNKPIPKSWEVYQGEFVMVHATYQSHLAGDVYFAPNCKPNDGIIWLLVVKAGISRVHLLQFLLALSNGTHLKYPFVEMIPVFAFRLEPMCGGSHIVVDGEVLPHSSVIQAEVFPGVVSLLNKLPPTVSATTT